MAAGHGGRVTQELNDGLPAREGALALIDAALSRRGGLDEAASANGFRFLEPRERAFARALAMAALRHLGPIDRALAGKLAKEPPPRVRNLLRLGATQAFFLEVPAFAAVATSVELAGANKASRPVQGPGQRRAARPAARRPPCRTIRAPGPALALRPLDQRLWQGHGRRRSPPRSPSSRPPTCR
jgi:hypothetical protein